MDKITELEQRIDEYRQHSLMAEKIALQKLRNYAKPEGTPAPSEVLRRELLRHHTRTLLLDEVKQWIQELQGIRVYQLYALPNSKHEKEQVYQIRQQMTEREAAEVNATYEANNERLRWRPIEHSEQENKDE